MGEGFLFFWRRSHERGEQKEKQEPYKHLTLAQQILQKRKEPEMGTCSLQRLVLSRSVFPFFFFFKLKYRFWGKIFLDLYVSSLRNCLENMTVLQFISDATFPLPPPPLDKEKFLKHSSGMRLGLGSTIKQHWSFKSVAYYNLQNISFLSYH